MKAISIYALTRNQNMECVQKLERQLSSRDFFLRIKEWELESMKALVKQLELHMEEVYKLRFFYSFQIPKLGKEFDLLQIKDDQIVNIELKSGIVSDEAIRRQLIQNRYYLSVFGKPILSYTYISSEDYLVRLTNHDHIVEGDWKQLCIALGKESPDYEGDDFHRRPGAPLYAQQEPVGIQREYCSGRRPQGHGQCAPPLFPHPGCQWQILRCHQPP